jgi:hypothetical protein
MKCVVALFFVLGLGAVSGFGATKKKVVKKAAPVAAAKKAPAAAAKKRSTAAARRTRTRVRRVYSPWKEPTYADSTSGDDVDGEDLIYDERPLRPSVPITDLLWSRIRKTAGF